MLVSDQQKKAFQNKIFSWWTKHKRDLPWRQTHDPYKILVSEVMLQQTQVLRVVAKYREFIERYPTVIELAKASSAEVLRIWKGMGYNRRALYLRESANIITRTFKGKFPRTEKEFRELPGVGTYTARAILVFAYKQEIAMVDTNIRQIITHFFFDDKPQKPFVIQKLADQLLPKGKSWEWHQALMDYGALELPRTKNSGLKTFKSKQPFRESNRYFRGRIIDRLREGMISQGKLINQLHMKYGKDKESLRKLVQGLEKDGLVSRTKTGIISLPK